MPQQTNLNVSPYFDDFDPNSDYHKVLFKPGYPVQARELTTLQSILQNQVEKFGQHFFKEGAKVIPGNISYRSEYKCIQLENNFQNIPVSAYADQLVGTKITGQSSGVSAYVDSVLFPENSEREVLTLYINYLNSSTTNNSTETFFDGELLTCSEPISSGLLSTTTIPAGTPVASTLSFDAATSGSAFHIENGVYFIRGSFVNVNSETLLLDQYGNTPSYRIGLFINEEVITSDLDETLNDNSQGFNNYAAPGADRLKIGTSLFKKSLTDLDDDNFVLLGTVINGAFQSKARKGDLGGGTGYVNWTETLARRTFEESGNYYTKPFNVSVVESLNNRIGNRGIYSENQTTSTGLTPEDSLALYKISPGKAYVKGFEIETVKPLFLDAEKPRTTRTLKGQSITYNTGASLVVNNIFRSPTVGVGNSYFVSLRDQRATNDPDQNVPGTEVGVARVYDFKLESGSYNLSNQDHLNEWAISLYDIQSTTILTLNQAITLNTPTFVKGANTGATGFLRSDVSNSTSVTLYDTTGSFTKNERLIINGIDDGRIITQIVENSISNAKSIYATDDGVVGLNTFSADIVQSNKLFVGIATVGAEGAETVDSSVIRSSNPLFPGDIKVSDLLQFTDNTTGLSDPSVVRVTVVGNDSVTVVGVQTVSGIAEGNLPSATLDVTDLTVLTTEIASSSDNSLVTILPKDNVSNVDLKDASITIRRSFTVNIASNELSTQVIAGTNESFLPFDEERYLLTRSDGTTETLTVDKLDISTNGSTLQIRNLTTNDTGATLVATMKKISPKEKVKLKNRVKTLVIDKSQLVGSGIGETTLNNGLTHGSYPFGTRVEDEIISLNTPDVIEIHGVYESADTAVASAPRVLLSSINTDTATTEDLIIGERIVGQTSGAVAIVAEKISNSTISFIYKNEILFIEGETVEFEESGSGALVTTLTTPSFNISPNFKFKSGQDESIYDFGTLRRNSDSTAPSKQLKVYFSSAYYLPTDDGDITTVNSYEQFDYTTEMKTINVSGKLTRTSDIIDIRPRVSDYTTTESERSPLEFLGRSFDSSGQSAANLLASNENITTDISYYQGRIDRVFLSHKGNMQVVYGTPSDNPQKPESIDDAVEICTINLPPYLYSTKDARIFFLDHKRYQMRDIRNLETRIKNLEYSTVLSLLEKDTSSLFIPDSEGLNRFKSGFFVDNFTSFLAQETSTGINNSIDRQRNELRPKHYTTSSDLIFGPVIDVDPDVDQNFSIVEGVNVTKQNDVVTLDYAEVEYLRQYYGTRTESVTPFLISFWQGTLELTPASDTWVDTVRLEAKIIDVEGDYTETMNNLAETQGIDPQTGFGPVLWNSWETNWSGETRSEERISAQRFNRIWHGWGATDQVLEDTLDVTVEDGIRSRTGTRTVVTENFDRTSVGDRVVSRDLIQFMRSRNIQFDARRVKPLTRMYAFFDGIDVTRYCTPKLLEIEMTTGTFQVGEVVTGRMENTGLSEKTGDTTASITFRVASLNHREGPFNAPTAIYRQNPYNGSDIGSTYSSTSTILNVDVLSLSNQARGDFFGFAATDMVLVGRTSGATARITNLRLVSDIAAVLIGSYFVPNPNNINFPRFETGSNNLTLVNDPNNNQVEATTIAEEGFESAGTLETVQENIISVRNARIESRAQAEFVDVSRDLASEVVDTRVVSSNTWWFPPPPPPPRNWGDPLAQSFIVDDDTGVFLTSVDLFFASKDDMDIPASVQIRTMLDGVPSQKILPFSEVTVDPSDIITSTDGSVATNIQFKAPVYLEGRKDYCIVVLSNSTKYDVYISRVGENDLVNDTFVSTQPYLGSLFKSQNASTWEPSQWEDLKFTLYRAEFVSNGQVDLYNPQLAEGNGQVAKLLPDSISLSSRKIRVGLGTTVADSYEIGNTFSQVGTNATGNLVGTAGSITSSGLNITNGGIGYLPASGSNVYNGVNLVTITGNGSGATADVTINNGAVDAATVVVGGSGYQVGDVVEIAQPGSTNVGRNSRLTITGIGLTSELILDNVQGEFVVAGAGKSMMFVDSAGLSTHLNSDHGGNVHISFIDVVSDGLHFNVNHKNHGMYFTQNKVQISNVASDIKPTKLTAEYTSGSTGQIAVESGTSFGTFENVGVGTTNPGYLLIGEEVVEYTDVDGNSIGGDIVRGEFAKTYPVGTPVYKYELGGINLNRINKVHNLEDVTASDPFTFDSYKIKIDTSAGVGATDRSTDVGFPKLYIGNNKSTGGYRINASQNIPYEILTPNIHNVTVPKTSISAQVRTITSKSFSGNEVPYADQGFENIVINRPNYFDTPRMIASKVNEDERLDNMTGNKSLNMRLFLNTYDSKVSPVIDGQRVNAILTSNRVNSVITNYATDSRANSLKEDPTACQYTSKEIVLENPASSIKIIVSAYVNSASDLRAFYSIHNKTGIEPIFTPFPGYANINQNGEVIAQEDSNGESDVLITKSSRYAFESEDLDFKEYVFTVDNVPSFRTYRVKLALTSTNQSFVPRIKDLRVIALA